MLSEHRPSLFERDPVRWDTGHDISCLLQKLHKIKQDPAIISGAMELFADDKQSVVTIRYRDDERVLLGIFSLRGPARAAVADLPDGEYRNLLCGTVEIRGGCLDTGGKPIILSHSGR